MELLLINHLLAELKEQPLTNFTSHRDVFCFLNTVPGLEFIQVNRCIPYTPQGTDLIPLLVLINIIKLTI